MTIAVCFDCGEIKFGAFVACMICQRAPATEQEAEWSLRCSDRFVSIDELKQISEQMRAGGRRPELRSLPSEPMPHIQGPNPYAEHMRRGARRVLMVLVAISLVVAGGIVLALQRLLG